MLQKLKKREEGFTIIEVLIVLAIAGLILLIVFLAVPALQRNSRNTQRKNDASSLLGAIQEYIDNNNGQMPTTADNVTANAKLGFYTESGDVVFSKGSVPTIDKDHIYIITGAVCSGSTATTTNATSRNVTVAYQIESSSGTANQCVQN